MSASKTITFGSTANQRPYGILMVSETSTSTANNTSIISVSLILKRPFTVSSSSTKTASCTINGTQYSWSGTISGSGDKTLISQTQIVTHNLDGSKIIDLEASIDLDISWSGTTIGTISGSGTLALTNISRYATANQTLNSKTETTVTMNWSSDSTIDFIWWSVDNGSNWTGINVTDGKSGSYTISGLIAETAYNVKTRVRRKDTQQTTDSATLSVTTYSYPYANSMPSFTIGSKLTIGLFNPLKRSITVNILGADGTQISSDTTVGTSISGYNGENIVNRFYASIPNTKSGTYRVKVTYGSHITTKTGGMYTVNVNDCKPSIGDVSYKDTDSTCTTLTGNNQLIIRNHSKVQFSATSLTGSKSASISSCEVKVNANNHSMSLSGSTATVNNIAINSASNIIATFTVTDSRGIAATKNLLVTILDWVLPTAIITLQRQNNFHTETNINVNADYSSLDNKNTLTIQARYKKISDPSFGNYVNLDNGITTVLSLDNSYEWNVQVLLTDKLGSTTYNLVVGKGFPIVFFDRILKSTGFNCFPVDTESVEINGINIMKKVTRSVMTRSLSTSMTNLVQSTYTIVPFDLDISNDTLLAATNDGGIQIGTGINYVSVSAQLGFYDVQSDGIRHIKIVKNSYTSNNTIAWSCDFLASGYTKTLTISPILAEVISGDVIYLLYFTGDTSDTIDGDSHGAITSITVETK